MLPLYKIIFDESFSPSSLKMSLVKDPAVESLFLKFKSEQAQRFKFSVESEDEHIIYGVAIRADFPIYRNDDQLGEYFIQFSKDSVAQIEAEFLKSQHFNLDHENDTNAVQVLESFIIDRESGINPAQFGDIEDGSWILKCKIHSEDLWKQIKSGEFAGFSIEAFFSYSRVEMSAQGIGIGDTTKQTKSNQHIMNIKQLKTKLAKLLLKLGTESAIKDGQEFLLEYDGSELVDGTEVFITDEAGELVHPEDGEYTINGEVWQINDGIVKKVDGEPETEVEVQPETEEVQAEETPEPEPEPEPESKEQPFDVRAAIDLMNARMDEMSQLLNDLTKVSEKVTSRLEELEAKLSAITIQTPEKLEKQTVKSSVDTNPYACLRKN